MRTGAGRRADHDLVQACRDQAPTTFNVNGPVVRRILCRTGDHLGPPHVGLVYQVIGRCDPLLERRPGGQELGPGDEVL